MLFCNIRFSAMHVFLSTIWHFSCLWISSFIAHAQSTNCRSRCNALLFLKISCFNWLSAGQTIRELGEEMSAAFKFNERPHPPIATCGASRLTGSTTVRFIRMEQEFEFRTTGLDLKSRGTDRRGQRGRRLAKVETIPRHLDTTLWPLKILFPGEAAENVSDL